MSTGTIDYGIDLGTTNSVIAVVRNGELEVIENNQHKATPSMVYIDKKGRISRGYAARAHLANRNRAGDVAAEFKREMGQETTWEFKAAGSRMSPEELSAEILKELRGGGRSSIWRATLRGGHHGARHV